ncbi:hypothetical protein [Staphylococcus hominis]|uniref:hypothetical protein n=1 Tax=Staphylococcus hominis TaxID=1290 RepID=UPI001F595AC2|nr:MULTISPECIES: hypothetical protein [Staphylococcus]MCI2871707.1 hypothetical protein [Staphylococcus hominis]MCI2875953.1 hypothetical protein [Staphylococcus hominis]MCI2891652.1 hypothetical protein [Staphylococcus hominis]
MNFENIFIVLVDIVNVWQQEQPQFPSYASGSYGPKESEKLLRKDGLNWWNNL